MIRCPTCKENASAHVGFFLSVFVRCIQVFRFPEHLELLYESAIKKTGVRMVVLNEMLPIEFSCAISCVTVYIKKGISEESITHPRETCNRNLGKQKNPQM